MNNQEKEVKPEMPKASIFTVKDENGNNIEYKILFTFYSDETKKDYVVYTDDSENSDGEKFVYASIYDNKSKSKELLPIETEEEWATIESIYSKLEESLK